MAMWFDGLTFTEVEQRIIDGTAPTIPPDGMIAVPRGFREWRRVTEREQRLCRMIEIRAPHSIIEAECRLLMSAYHGGHWRAIMAWMGSRIGNRLARIGDHAQWNAHRLAQICRIPLHFRDMDGDCWCCGEPDEPIE